MITNIFIDFSYINKKKFYLNDVAALLGHSYVRLAKFGPYVNAQLLSKGQDMCGLMSTFQFNRCVGERNDFCVQRHLA